MRRQSGLAGDAAPLSMPPTHLAGCRVADVDGSGRAPKSGVPHILLAAASLEGVQDNKACHCLSCLAGAFEVDADSAVGMG